ncbi:hypothetical protein [Desulfotruncus alcoholivorax]|uniref:hypothetical protein n=1 Tax=Desulfotruncus alcoholivorax TaxID=265477 RepID=UPI0003F767E6|nr:hypothetical protein [Desulfotruncus alcoholivorax]
MDSRQQLFRELLTKDAESGSISLYFNEVKECFKFHNNYDIESMKCWEKIKELRLLVNVIKHAEGKSADRLRKIRPDYFKWDKRGVWAETPMLTKGKGSS